MNGDISMIFFGYHPTVAVFIINGYGSVAIDALHPFFLHIQKELPAILMNRRGTLW